MENKVKLLPFREWLKITWKKTPDDLTSEPISFQQMVHHQYRDYVEMWENERLYEKNH